MRNAFPALWLCGVLWLSAAGAASVDDSGAGVHAKTLRSCFFFMLLCDIYSYQTPLCMGLETTPKSEDSATLHSDSMTAPAAGTTLAPSMLARWALCRLHFRRLQMALQCEAH